jgi:choline-sulfatase
MYYGMVTFADEEMGRIVRKLDELGLRENTIIIYTADHGEMLGDRGIWYKNTFYEGSAGIPFIWSFPKALPQGKVVRAPAMNMDVLPTLAELCGLPRPAGLEGSSLVPVMNGRSDGAERYALSENYRGNFAGRMIRTARWKYFFYTTGEEFLYDLEADPGEESNLIRNPDHRKVADELKQKATAGWINQRRGVRELVGLPPGASESSAKAKRAKKRAEGQLPAAGPK